MAEKKCAEDAYGLTWRTVIFALDVMIEFARCAEEDEGDPELRGAGRELEDALKRVANYYYPLATRP